MIAVNGVTAIVVVRWFHLSSCLRGWGEVGGRRNWPGLADQVINLLRSLIVVRITPHAGAG